MNTFFSCIRLLSYLTRYLPYSTLSPSYTSYSANFLSVTTDKTRLIRPLSLGAFAATIASSFLNGKEFIFTISHHRKKNCGNNLIYYRKIPRYTRNILFCNKSFFFYLNISFIEKLLFISLSFVFYRKM